MRLIACVLALSIASAAAQDSLLNVARDALLRGDIAVAQQSLAEIDETQVTDRNDLDFLKGTLATQAGDYDAAIAAFRSLLARDPSLNRVRLDLAQAYFLKGDDTAATVHFRAAVAQGVPPEVEVNIASFLEQIRRRKRWDASLSIAVAPDSNINAATAADSIDLFGLPFVLDPSAQRKSGVGLTVSAAGAYRWPLADNLRLRTGVSYFGTEYANDGFSDRHLMASAGPALIEGPDTETALLATASRRWFAGQDLSYSTGLRLETQRALSPRWLLNAALSWENRTYDWPQYGDYSGPVYTLYGGVTYALDGSSAVIVSGGAVREQAHAESLRAWQYIAGVQYFRENLWQRFAVGVGIQGALIRYDAPLPIFGITRRDEQIDYRVSIANAHIDIWGFTPVLSVVHSDRYSNITLYTYHRNRAEIGVRRNF